MRPRHRNLFPPARPHIRLSLGLVLLFALALSACEQPFTLAQVLDGSGTPLAVSPAEATIVTGETLQLEAAGGFPPYSFSLVEGQGSVDDAGLVSAPADPGALTVEVRDRGGSSVRAVITVIAPPAALTISPAETAVQVAREVTFSAAGGIPPYVFTLSKIGSGSPGLDSGTGAYTAGSEAGTDIVSVTDSKGATAGAVVTVSIDPPAGDGPRDVDYQVTSVSHGTGTTVGGPVTGSFVMKNLGSMAGERPVYWRVVASVDVSYEAGSDVILDAGEAAALGAGEGSNQISFSGQWPSVANTYRLLVVLSVEDDTDTSNNVGASSPVSVSGTVPPPDVDYVAGDLVIAAPVSGRSASGTFDVTNNGTDPGSATIFWTLQISSDTVLDGGDRIVRQGQIAGPHAQGATHVDVAIDGTWYEAPGAYSLFLSISASDDIDPGNNIIGPTPVTLTQANVDYSVTSVTGLPGSATGGDPLPAAIEFTVENTGTDDGMELVRWDAYASIDGVLDASGEVSLGGGTLDPDGMTAGQIVGPIQVGGYWPSSPDDYSIIVQVSASDDVAPGNDVRVSAGTTTVSGLASNVDYTATSVTNTGGTTGGGALSGSFVVQNTGSSNGGSTVSWSAYVSTNMSLGGGDIEIGSGTTPALGSGAASAPIAFAGTWPEADGTYYLLVALSASDDGAVANNVGASGAVSVTGTPPPDIDYEVTTGPSTPSAAVTGGAVSQSFVVTNTGADPGAQPGYWTAYVSSDAFLGGDTQVDSGSFGALAATASTAPIAIDEGFWPATPGTYYLIVSLSVGDDSDTSNNVVPSAGFTVNAREADYRPENWSYGTSVAKGDPLSASFDIRNYGPDDGTAQIAWDVYVSADATVDGADRIAANGTIGALANGGVQNVSVSGTWTESPGSYRLIAVVSSAEEANTANDVLVTPGAVTVAPPDVNYVPTNWSNGTSFEPGDPMAVSFDIDNLGPADGSAGTQVTWVVRVSADTVAGSGDRIVDTGSEAALSAAAAPTTVNISDTWTELPGTYYLLASISNTEDTAAGNTGDNVLVSSAITITVPDVDYSVAGVTRASATAGAGTAFNETFTFTNTGTSNGAAPVSWYAYISTDQSYQVTDTLVGSGSAAGLASGAVSSPVNVSGSWPGSPGTYYLLIRLQSNDDVDPGNNTGTGASVGAFAPSTVDYVVNNVTRNYPIVGTSTTISESFRVRNIGDTAGAANISWSLYASGDEFLDGGDSLILNGTTGALGAGVTGASIFPGGSWPSVAGTYYLLVEISAPDESGGATGNNIGAAGPFSVSDPPNYTVGGLTDPATPALVGTPGSGELRILERGGHPGLALISWDVYLSDDDVLGSDGSPVAAGNLGALEADDGAADGPDEATIAYNFTWPAQPGVYRQFLTIDAADDSDGTDNVELSPKRYLVAHYIEVEPNDEAPPPPAVNDANVMMIGSISAGQTITVAGVSDVAGAYDTYKVLLSGAAANVHVRVEWFTGDDTLDLDLWGGAGGGVSSADVSPNIEPATGSLSKGPWSDGEGAYVGVYTFDDTIPNAPYLLWIWAD